MESQISEVDCSNGPRNSLHSTLSGSRTLQIFLYPERVNMEHCTWKSSTNELEAFPVSETPASSCTILSKALMLSRGVSNLDHANKMAFLVGQFDTQPAS
ncbi:hypothetical protein Droror1_Dr00000752 [Drosera rotundifolia]